MREIIHIQAGKQCSETSVIVLHTEVSNAIGTLLLTL